MNELQQWQSQNDAYLSAALAWLRLRLLRLADQEEMHRERGDMKETGGFQGLFKRRSEEPKPAPKSDAPDGERLQQAQDAMDEAAAAFENGHRPAHFILAERFGLSPFERDVLLLCAAMELDTGIAALCARAQGDGAKPWPTFALALSLFDEPAWDALSPERPLRYWHLIDVHLAGHQPLTGGALRADERIVNYIKGLNYLDDRLNHMLIPMSAEEPGVALPPSHQRIAEASRAFLQSLTASGRPGLLQWIGTDPASKYLLARHLADELGLTLYRLPLGLVPRQSGELDTLARLWSKESVLLPVALYLDAQDETHEQGKAEPASTAHVLRRFLDRCRGIVILGSREVQSLAGHQGLVLEVEKPTPAEQEKAWLQVLGDGAAKTAGLLASQFHLNLETIAAVAEENHDGGPQPYGADATVLWRACMGRTRPQMDLLAPRIDAKATWDDIVLPEREMTALRQVAAQVAQRNKVYDHWGFRERMNRGLGISALFAGESGTGKTMAAEVLANALELNLYRIDLAAVVSKYIGETEKNLRKLFDVAEDGGAILLFDEADALFGKRSEVKDSHDRYANIEINYLLQRMEAYRGLAILATNMKSALDTAFMRRLRFLVNFPFPGTSERARIWQRAFPAQVPMDGLDWRRLARLNLTGGSIHNIALNAAFLAANESGKVDMEVVLRAARDEYRKMERPINEADFRLPEGVAS